MILLKKGCFFVCLFVVVVVVVVLRPRNDCETAARTGRQSLCLSLLGIASSPHKVDAHLNARHSAWNARLVSL